LTEISYPVFRLGTEKPVFEDGVVLYITRTRDEDATEIVNTYRIVDDTNLPGKSLAVRRLRLLAEGVRLKRITRAVFFLGDLVKLATSNTWFIDAVGNVFRYVRKTRAKLQFKKITQILPIKTGGAVVEVEGLPNRFKCLYAPRPDEKYAGVLKYGLSYILYGVYTEQYDDTWRLI
jgi:hypothetical protein